MHKHPLFKAYKDDELIYPQYDAIDDDATFMPECAEEIRLFTGMCDPNGDPIYEKDIVIRSEKAKTKGVVTQGKTGEWKINWETTVGSSPLFYQLRRANITLFTEQRKGQQRKTVPIKYDCHVGGSSPHSVIINEVAGNAGRRSNDDRRKS